MNELDLLGAINIYRFSPGDICIRLPRWEYQEGFCITVTSFANNTYNWIYTDDVPRGPFIEPCQLQFPEEFPSWKRSINDLAIMTFGSDTC